MSRSRFVRLTTVLILLIASSAVSGQSATSNATRDEDLVTRWDDSIDFEGCASDLLRADRNGDGAVKQDEFLNFIQEYGKRLCFSSNELTIQQSGVFITLSCICRSQEGSNSQCCMGNNAKIPTSGAELPQSSRSPSQNDYLTSVCKLTDATIDARCPPVVNDRDEPIIPILPGGVGTAPIVPPPAAGGGGMQWWHWLLIALAALLLFCCCCCCLFKRRRAKQAEEEQEDEHMDVATTDVEKGAGPRNMDMEQPLDKTEPYHGSDPDMKAANVGAPEPEVPFPEPTVPADVSPMIAAAMASGAVVGPESDDEEEVRRKRGGNRIPEEPDEEIVKYRGAPPFPPPEVPPPPPRALNPIPDKEPEDTEWDQPGRDIQFPVEKDDMSAGEVDHYEPDGGVHNPQRPTKDPVEWNRDWNRAKPEEPDEVDARKHRIQTGLGDCEVWNKLDEESTHVQKSNTSGDGMFDWVIQSALGALGETTTTTDDDAPSNDDAAPSTQASSLMTGNVTALERIGDSTDDEAEFA